MTTVENKEDQYQLLEDDFDLLFELGFVAIKQSDFTSSNQLFQAVKAIDPDDTSHEFGLACIAMHKLELSKSAELLKKYIESNPNNERVQKAERIGLRPTGQGAPGPWFSSEIDAGILFLSNIGGLRRWRASLLSMPDPIPIDKHPLPEEFQ